MSVIVKLADRFYDFYSYEDADVAQTMFYSFSGSQDEFEECMDTEGIVFWTMKSYHV